MSHFIVLVFGGKVDEQLAAYAEDTSGLKESQLEFVDSETEGAEKYETGTVKLSLSSSGKAKLGRSELDLSKAATKRFKDFMEGRSGEAEVPFKTLFASFDEYMEDWEGSSKDEKKGKYGYWTNPNAKWDWYSMGGRWTGFFKLKEGRTGKLGRSGAFDNKPEKGTADECAVGDVDLEGMMSDVRAKADEFYSKVENIAAGRPFPYWKEIRERHGDDVDAARAEYGSLQIVKDFSKEGICAFEGGLGEAFGCGREAYVEEAGIAALVPYAYVRDGKWHGRGKMGWWGMSSEEADKEEWGRQFLSFWKSLPEDEKVTAIDCHI